MTIKIVIEFLQGTTVRVRAYVYDDDGDLVDPTTSITIEMWDSEGTKVVGATTTTMDFVSTGIYEYYYNTDTDSPVGNWRGIVWATDTGSKVSEGSFGFKVKA